MVAQVAAAAMGGGPVMSLGVIQGTVSMKLPDAEKAQLNTMQRHSPQLKRIFDAFSRSGAAQIMTAASATAFVLSGQGFRQTLGVLWDIMGLISDLLFIGLMPVIKPLMEGFKDFAMWISSHEGGIFGAIADPELWRRIGELFLGAIMGLGTSLAMIGTHIMRGFINMMKDPSSLGEVSPWFKQMATMFVSSLSDLIATSLDLVTNFVVFLVKVFTDPKLMPALEQMGRVMAGAFFDALNPTNAIGGAFWRSMALPGDVARELTRSAFNTGDATVRWVDQAINGGRGQMADG